MYDRTTIKKSTDRVKIFSFNIDAVNVTTMPVKTPVRASRLKIWILKSMLGLKYVFKNLLSSFRFIYLVYPVAGLINGNGIYIKKIV